MAEAIRDQNHVTAMLFMGSDGLTYNVEGDEVTGRIYVDLGGAPGTGTVTDVSVVSANGFAGSVANSTTTPAITISTTVTGILKGNGTAISAAVANTDYQSPITLTTTGSSGAATFDGTTLNIPQYTGGGGGGQVDSVVGTANRITVDSADPANPIVDISASYVGQASITTLGTIGTGTWNATAIAVNKVAAITASRAVVSDGSGFISAATTTATEIGYVNGVTSAIQTQINGKQATITFGTGVQTALGVNVGTAGSVVVNGGALGTPSSGTVTNLTGTASININGTVGATTPSTGVFTTLVAGSTTSLLLGTAGSAVGNIGFRNATSGTITLAPVTGALGTVTLSLPAATDQLVGRATTDTLTNKRPQPRTASSTTASNLSPDLATANVYYRTTQTATLTIDAPTGTPVIGEVLMIYVDSAGAQTLTINGTYVPFGAAFPATTTAGKTFMMSAQYNGTNWKTLWANAI